jgi:hypothetical protein
MEVDLNVLEEIVSQGVSSIPESQRPFVTAKLLAALQTVAAGEPLMPQAREYLRDAYYRTHFALEHSDSFDAEAVRQVGEALESWPILASVAAPAPEVRPELPGL